MILSSKLKINLSGGNLNKCASKNNLMRQFNFI